MILFFKRKTYIKSLENKISTQQKNWYFKKYKFKARERNIKITSSLALKNNSLKDSTSILDNLKLKNERL